YMSINRFDRIFDLFYWPVLDIFIWGFMTSYIHNIADINLMSIVLGGIILWVFVWRASQDITVYLLEDFWSKSLYNLFSSPVMLKELVISLLLLGVIRAFISFLFLSTIALLLYSMNIFSLGIISLAVFVLSLLIFAWAIGLFISAFIMRWGSRVQVLAWSVVWLVQPFSCVFYPLSALPQWAQPIARMLPTTHVFEGMRAVMQGNSISLMQFLNPIIISIVFFIACYFFLYSSFKQAKSKGLLAKNE
ncbi:MAG: ABC transporter permease, partial [Candidatus Woesearchaeota archaeon]